MQKNFKSASNINHYLIALLLPHDSSALYRKREATINYALKAWTRNKISE
jgi:hypothetical protein